MKRAKKLGMIGAVAGAAMALGSVLSGCGGGPSGGGESLEARAARIQPALLGVPGVTGGEVSIKNASLSHFYNCRLTSDAQGSEAMKTVLTDALKELLAQTADEDAGAQVKCLVVNGSDIVSTGDLGLNNPSWLGQLREKLG